MSYTSRIDSILCIVNGWWIKLAKADFLIDKNLRLRITLL